MGQLKSGIDARFETLKARAQEFHVPEWDFTFYAGPWTFGQWRTVEPLATDGNIDFLREVLRVKAKTKDGTPAIDAADMDALEQRSEGAVLSRVANEILEAFPIAGADEAAKKP